MPRKKKTETDQEDKPKKAVPEGFLNSSRNKGNKKFDKETVIDALARTGTIRGAAEILDCSRHTIANYMKDDPEIKAAVEEARADLLDLAEYSLMKNIAAGHPASIFFILKTLGKDRGYVERTETTGKDGVPLNNNEPVQVTFVNASNKDD